MAVGTDAISVYQGETTQLRFTITDSTGNLTSIAGQTIKFVVKATAASVDPPLIGPTTCTHISETAPMTIEAAVAFALAAGSYVLGIRREESGPTVKWQYVHSPVTVVDSANQD